MWLRKNLRDLDWNFFIREIVTTLLWIVISYFDILGCLLWYVDVSLVRVFYDTITSENFSIAMGINVLMVIHYRSDRTWAAAHHHRRRCFSDAALRGCPRDPPPPWLEYDFITLFNVNWIFRLEIIIFNVGRKTRESYDGPSI